MLKILLDAYIDALFEMCASGQTFMVQANDMKHEVLDPHSSAREVFEAVERMPLDAFEAHLKTLAHRKMRQARKS
jgi:hypothetical protein